MRKGIQRRALASGAWLGVAIVCGMSLALEPASSVSGTVLEPAVWQGPEFVAAPSGSDSTSANRSASSTFAPTGAMQSANPLRISLQPTPPVPPQTINVAPPIPPQTIVPTQPLAPPSAPTATLPTQPLLDDNSPTEDLLPPVVESGETYRDADRRGVTPYGGGHPTDWPWGCGGSPYRQGPGLCDDYRVGPRWHWTFDGLVMSRDETNLAALMDQMVLNDPTGTGGSPYAEDFDKGPGGRLTITSQVPRYVGYQIQAAYEGIIDWDTAIVFPKTSPADVPPAAAPVSPNSTQQRSLHYTSDYNSGEINWVRSCDEDWHPFCGVRYIQLGERLNDVLNQETPPPLPGAPPQGPFTIMDMKNLFEVDNNLFGFQVGMLHEAWCVNRRFTIEGFVNGGVYYNKIQYFNKMGSYTTQFIADDLATPTVDESRIDFADSVNKEKSDFNEIAYVGEASISGVCRLNRCWAMRAGYQVLWINHVHLADAAFLGDPEQSDDLIFHGWHAGIECRR